uniref:SPOR domain-containing protein n=1 Tax=uncultured Sphingomonas sp. TaxID=158754 RepID=UPI0035C9BA73
MLLLLPILALAAQAAPDAPPEVAQAAGPRGTSGEVREDLVGYASVMTEPPEARFAGVTIAVAHPSLPAGTLVELTALDTGRTILAMVVARASGVGVVALSPGAAQALGVGERAGVRVRTVVASPQDDRALRSGQAASQRLDAPPTLLTALRRKLPQGALVPNVTPARPIPVRGAAPSAHPPVPRLVPVPRPAPVRAPAALPPARGGLMVQVAALSSAPRATALAQQLGGRVVPLGKLYRVQLGPFGDTASAQRARDGAARRGYADARIIHTD